MPVINYHGLEDVLKINCLREIPSDAEEKKNLSATGTKFADTGDMLENAVSTYHLYLHEVTLSTEWQLIL